MEKFQPKFQPKLQILTVCMNEYILKPMLFSITSLQVVTQNLWGLLNIQKAVIVVYGLPNSFYKKKAFTVKVWTVQTIPYKLKLNRKIRRYPAMLFVVMRFKERNFQRRISNYLKLL